MYQPILRVPSSSGQPQQQYVTISMSGCPGGGLSGGPEPVRRGAAVSSGLRLRWRPARAELAAGSGCTRAVAPSLMVSARLCRSEPHQQSDWSRRCWPAVPIRTWPRSGVMSGGGSESTRAGACRLAPIRRRTALDWRRGALEAEPSAPGLPRTCSRAGRAALAPVRAGETSQTRPPAPLRAAAAGRNCSRDDLADRPL